MKLNNTLFKIAAAALAVLVLHVIATLTGMYEIFWWFDIPMHYAGGVAIGIASYFLLQDFEKRDLHIVKSKILQFLIIIAIVGLAAIAWETFEYLLDAYGHTSTQVSISDTLKDIAMGLLGGSTAAAIIIKFKKRF